MKEFRFSALKGLFAALALFFACGQSFARELVTASTVTIKNAEDDYLTGDVSISLLEIENNSGQIVIDVQGHNLSINTLRIGYYDILTHYNGDVVFKDSVGGGSVVIDVINATAWNQSKVMEIQSPLTVTVTNTLNADTGGHGGSAANLTVKGNGNLSVTGSVNGNDYLDLYDIAVNGNVSGITITGPFTWTGASSTSWDNPGNWDIPAVPGNGAVVIIGNVDAGSGNYPVTGSSISLKSLQVDDGASLKINSNNLSIGENLENAGSIDVGGTITVGGDLVNTDTLKAGGTITVAGSAAIEGKVISSGNQEYDGDVTLSGNAEFDAGSANVSFLGQVLGSGGSEHLVIDANIAEFSGNVSDIKNLIVRGTSLVKGNVSTSGDQSYEGLCTIGADVTFKAGTTGNPKTVVFGSPGMAQSVDAGTKAMTLKSNGEIYGENNFIDLKIDNSGFGAATNVDFEGGKLQKITAFSAKGSDSANKLTLGSTDGSGTLKWDVYFGNVPVAANFSYVQVKNSRSLNVSGDAAKELGIVPGENTVVDALPEEPSAISWFIHKYYWVGKSNSKWSDVANWAFDQAGNLQAPVPGFDNGLSEIILNKVDGGYDLELADEVTPLADPKVLKLKNLTVNAGNRFGLADYTVETYLDSGTAVSNLGTVAVYGTQAGAVFVTRGTSTVFHGNDSTIEYYGNQAAADVLFVSESGTTKTYKKLKVVQSGGSIEFASSVNAASFEDAATVSGTFKRNVTVGSGSGSLSLLGDWRIGDAGNAAAAVAVNASVVNGKSLAFDSDVATISGSYSGDGAFTACGTKTTVGGAVNFQTGTFNHNGGTFVLNGNSLTCKTDGTTVFNNLEIGATSAASSVSVTNKMNVDGNMTNRRQLIVNQDCEFKGDVQTEQSMTVKGTAKFSGTSAQKLYGAASFTAGTLECANTFAGVSPDPSGLFISRDISAKNFIVQTSSYLTCGSVKLTVSNDLVNAGTVNAGASVLAITSDFENTGIFYAENGTATVGRNFVNSGSYNGGSGILNVSGNFSNGGTYDAGTSTVKLTSTGISVIEGESAFYAFECIVPGKIIKFQNGKKQTFTNSFVITGASVSPVEDYSKYISLLSDLEDSSWQIDCTGATVNVTCAKIQDSKNLTKVSSAPLAADKVLVATTSQDLGNNEKWNFPGMLYVWKGEIDSVWHKKENWIPKSIPGDDACVQIGDVSTALGGSGNFPVCDESVVLLKIKITQNSNVDLNGYDLTVTSTESESFLNNGTVKSAGTEAVVLPSVNGAVVENGTWNYYGGTLKTIDNLKFNKINVSDSVFVSGTITASELKLTNSGNLTCSANATLNAAVYVGCEPTGSNFDNGGFRLQFEKTVESINDSGTLYSLKFDGSGTTVLKSDVNVKEIVSDSPLEIEGVKIYSAGNQTYKEAVKLSSSTSAAAFVSADAGSAMEFQKDITGSGKNIVFGESSGMATNRKVVIKGSVSGIDGLISYYPVKIDCTSADLAVSASYVLFNQDSIVTGQNSVTFNGLVDSGSNGSNVSLTCGTAELPTKLVLNKMVGSVKPLSFVKCFGEVDFNAVPGGDGRTVTTLGNQYYYGEVVAGANVILNVATDAGVANGAVQFGNDISGSGKTVSVLADVYISDSCEITVDSLTVGSSSAGGRNLHVSAINGGVNKVVDFRKPVKIYGNAIFYGGSIYVRESVDVSKDLVILGASYNGDDDGADQSKVSGLFAYNHALRTALNGCAVASYTGAFKTRHPDGTAIPTGSAGSFFGAKLTVDGGKTVSAGKNFYGNGTVLDGSGAWTLKVMDNEKATVAFAELYNSTINNCVVTGSSVAANAWLSASENCTGSGNTRVDFYRPLIAQAYTVLDDVVFVSFKDAGNGLSKKIENSNNEISKAVAHIKNSAGSYASAYMDEDCTESTDGKGDISQFYIRFGDGSRTSTKWNTDACGISAGATLSTDRNGVHHNVIPYLNLPKALNNVYFSLKDCHKSRIAHYFSATPVLPSDFSSSNENPGATYTKVMDKTSPVLICVKTGQEKHVAPNDAGGQSEYDGHNFIELVYSESVNIGGIDGKLDLPSDSGALTSLEIAASKNVQATAALGGISKNASGFKVAGLCSFASGNVETGSNGSDDNIGVHSLYRIFDGDGFGAGAVSYRTHGIRVGIAAFVDDTGCVTAAGNINHWLGYIKQAQMPSGVVARLENPLITDGWGNVLEYVDSAHGVNHRLSELIVNDGLVPGSAGFYGAWDVSGPVFASYNSKVTGLSDFFEAVGYTVTPSSAYLDRIEFHMLDSASMLESNEWYTKIGWTEKESSGGTLLVPAKDTAGGAKPFASGLERSVGGIRYSSIYDKVSHFGYSVVNGNSGRAFSGQAIGATSSALFLSSSGGVTSVDEYDSLYFALKLTDLELPLKTTFEITYDGNGYITDLAGNLMLPDVTTVIKSIDRVAPNFNLSIASVKTDGGVDGDELYVVFSKALQTGSFTIMKLDSTTETMNGLESIPKTLRIVTISPDGASVTPSTDLQIDDNVPARVVFANRDYTGLIIKLNRAVTLADMERYYIQCNVGEMSIDPVSGTSAYVTYVQDILGNYMVRNSAHALTDFAVGVVNPIYAYDSKLLDDGSNAASQIYHEGSWAVHDWDRNQGNYGSLTYGYDLFISTKLNDGSADGVSELPSHITLYMAPVSKLSGDELSNNYNKNTGQNWRMWLPQKALDGSLWPVFDSLCDATNDEFGMVCLPVDAENPSVMNWSFSELNFSSFIKNEVQAKASDQILFLFGMQQDESGAPITICHAPEYMESTSSYTLVQMPLYAGRLENKGDLTSFDIWSIKLNATKLQRGGVTIMNNVIDLNEGEKTMIQVDMESDGPLNVIVMTLDGNIVQYLQHGSTTSGTHFYTWNGTTKGGKKVARGLYFIRVFGNGIDETRKVMVVK